MQVTSTKLLSVFSEAFDKIRKGELKTLIPFLYLFRLNGKPMNLRYHYQMAPLYNCVQPGHLVLMCGRQPGKSYASAAVRSCALDSCPSTTRFSSSQGPTRSSGL